MSIPQIFENFKSWFSCCDPGSTQTKYPLQESLSWILSDYKTSWSALLLSYLITVRVDSLYWRTKSGKLFLKVNFGHFLPTHRHRNWVALLWDFPCLSLACLCLLILISFHFIQWIKSSFVYVWKCFNWAYYAWKGVTITILTYYFLFG